ncbi:MAG: AAA family ATPase [Solirubrobacterales bacterium]|nr:AAA family ATPase [Solirubrobacterales bacterium]
MSAESLTAEALRAELAALPEGDPRRILIAERIDRENGINHYPAGNVVQHPTAAEMPENPVRLIRASDITPRRIQWLWTDRLPLQDLAVLAGEPGLGKSTTTALLAAQVTRGKLDGALNGKPRSVLLASAEDAFESVIWGRLSAAGADLTRVYNVELTGGQVTIPDDLGRIAERLADLAASGEPAALVVIDPIAAFLGGIDSHKDAAVRTALAPLAKMAQEQGLCVLAVAHLNKSGAGKLLDRISGSGAFGAAPRSVLAFARDPDDSAGEQGSQRVIVHAKSNHGEYAPTLAAHVESRDVAEVGSVSLLALDGLSAVGPQDQTSGQSSTNGAEVQEAIATVLAGGQRASSEVKSAVADSCSVTQRTVERAAKRMRDVGELTITAQGFPKQTFWAIPPIRQNPVPQSRQAQSRQGVVTEPVVTANPPETLGMQGVENPSHDSSGDVSSLDESGAET